MYNRKPLSILHFSAVAAPKNGGAKTKPDEFCAKCLVNHSKKSASLVIRAAQNSTNFAPKKWGPL
jgi:hypothetical protein